MSTSRSARIASSSRRFSSRLSVLALIPTPAGAVQTPESVVVNPDPADWTPDILDGQVNAILQMGTKVIVGGTFTQVRRAEHSLISTRNFIFAFDMDTGVIDPNFVPVLNAEVEQIAPGPDGTSVFVGGDFSTVNGQSYKKLVRLNLSDGSIVTSFKANTNGLVQDLVLRQGALYVSGKFTLIKSIARSGLARLDPVTGNVDPNLNLPFTNPLRGTLGVPEIDVSPDGSKLIAIGSFSQVAGQSRVQIAMLDLTTTPATVSPWQTSVFPVHDSNGTTWCSSSFSTYMRDIDIAPDGSYFVVVTTGAFRANRLCDSDQPVRAHDDRAQPAAHVDRLDRWRHVVEREHQRHRGLRRRTLPVDEQLVSRRCRRPGRGAARGHRRALAGQRPPVHLEPGPRAWGRQLHAAGHRRRPLGRERHRSRGQRVPPEDRVLPGRRRDRPAADRHVCPAERPLQPRSGGRRGHEPSLLRPDDVRHDVDRAARASTGGTREVPSR